MPRTIHGIAVDEAKWAEALALATKEYGKDHPALMAITMTIYKNMVGL